MIKRARIITIWVFRLSSSVFQTAALLLGRGDSSRLSCSTLPFLPTRLRSPVVRGFTATHKSVDNRTGVEQLAKRSEPGLLIGARRRGFLRSRF
jgi:hypothetical protein